MLSPIGAVGKDFARIAGQRLRTRLAVVDIGRRDRDFLNQRGVGVGANLRLEAVNGGLALVLDPMAFVIFFACRRNDRRVDKSAGLHLYRLGFELAGDLVEQRLVQRTDRQRLAKANEGGAFGRRLVARKPAEFDGMMRDHRALRRA